MKTLSWHKDLLLCNSGDDFRDVKSSLELDLTKIPGYDSRLTCNSSCMCTWAESQLCYRDTSITYSSWSSPLWDWNQESKEIRTKHLLDGPFLLQKQVQGPFFHVVAYLLVYHGVWEYISVYLDGQRVDRWPIWGVGRADVDYWFLAIFGNFELLVAHVARLSKNPVELMSKSLNQVIFNSPQKSPS